MQVVSSIEQTSKCKYHVNEVLIVTHAEINHTHADPSIKVMRGRVQSADRIDFATRSLNFSIESHAHS